MGVEGMLARGPDRVSKHSLWNRIASIPGVSNSSSPFRSSPRDKDTNTNTNRVDKSAFKIQHLCLCLLFCLQSWIKTHSSSEQRLTHMDSCRKVSCASGFSCMWCWNTSRSPAVAAQKQLFDRPCPHMEPKSMSETQSDQIWRHHSSVFTAHTHISCTDDAIAAPLISPACANSNSNGGGPQRHVRTRFFVLIWREWAAKDPQASKVWRGCRHERGPRYLARSHSNRPIRGRTALLSVVTD